ncbi:potassium transporter Trk [Halobacteriales archaeon SW_12_71_31]|nr:MAG: potassium transporter Trk [Halobacteriales archaeon SW_12_71_31]
MRFVPVGYGRVGSRTARVLREEGHEVVVVEVDHERVDRAREAGVAVVEGDGGDEAVLERAGLAEADAVAGLTGDLNTNFAACSVGKHHGCRTVMRTDEDYRQDVYRQYADDVDELVYPERLGAAGAKTALLGGDFDVVADLAEHLQMTVLTIEEGSPAVGRRVVAVDLPQSGHIYAHGRADEPMHVPLPSTTIEAGDRVAVLVETDALDEVRSVLRPVEA